MNIFKKIRHFAYYQKILVFAWNTKEYNKTFQAKIPLWIGHASLDEIKALHKNQEMDLKVYSWQFLKEKIETASWKCIVARSEKRIVGYEFYSTDEMSFAGSKSIEFYLPTNAAYDFRLFVNPAFRNLSIHKELDDFRLKTLKQSGVIIAFGSVNSTNKPSIHNCKKTGGAVIGSVIFVKTRFFNKVFISKSLYKAGLTIKKIYS